MQSMRYKIIEYAVESLNNRTIDTDSRNVYRHISTDFSISRKAGYIPILPMYVPTYFTIEWKEESACAEVISS